MEMASLRVSGRGGGSIWPTGALCSEFPAVAAGVLDRNSLETTSEKIARDGGLRTRRHQVSLCPRWQVRWEGGLVPVGCSGIAVWSILLQLGARSCWNASVAAIAE